MKRPLLILVILFLWSPHTLAQAVKCIDAKGNTIYSNTGCPNNTTLDRIVDVPVASRLRSSPPPPSPPSSIDQSRYESYTQGTSTRENARLYAPPNPQLDLGQQLWRSNHLENAPQVEAALKAELVRQEAEDLVEEVRQEAEDLAEQAKAEAEERAEEARLAAEELEAELLNNEKMRNARSHNFYYFLFLLGILGLAFYKVAKDKKISPENQLKAHEKVGVCIILLSVVAAVSCLMVSSVWIPQLDIWQNLVRANGLSCSIMGYYIYSKHVILGCFMLICYGIVIYLDIFKAPDRLLTFFKDNHS